MSGTAPNSRIEVPYHLRRYVANHQTVPVGHFSVLTEMTQMLIAPMEMAGYTLPEHMVPDISHGRMCNWNSFGIRKMRIPVKATMDSDAWRPLDPIDDDQGGA